MAASRRQMELLSPAGDFAKLRTAAAYGADAVYIGGTGYGLRAKAKNFGDAELARAIEYAHKRGVKVYVAANIYATESDLAGAGGYFRRLAEIGADAAIVSDPGLFSLALEHAPGMDIHISTQANVTNSAAVDFWRRQGAKRIVMARELSLEDIRAIHERAGDGIELEVFAHGAMCVAYSGRCLLSAYMTGRSANKGECAHPCRYKYRLEEEKRQGLFMPVEEDGRGTYIMASKDLRMAERLPELARAGVRSLKIEGRMKSEYYVAAVTKVYRQALDDLAKGEDVYSANIAEYSKELDKAGGRDFSTGFFFGRPADECVAYVGEKGGSDEEDTTNWEFCGIVADYDAADGMAEIEQRNKFSKGDAVEFLTPTGKGFGQEIEAIYNADGREIPSAPHPKQRVFIKVRNPVRPLDIIRRRVDMKNGDSVTIRNN